MVWSSEDGSGASVGSEGEVSDGWDAAGRSGFSAGRLLKPNYDDDRNELAYQSFVGTCKIPMYLDGCDFQSLPLNPRHYVTNKSRIKFHVLLLKLGITEV